MSNLMYRNVYCIDNVFFKNESVLDIHKYSRLVLNGPYSFLS